MHVNSNRNYALLGLFLWALVLLPVGGGVVWAQNRDDDIGTKAIPDVLVYADPNGQGESERSFAIIVDKARQRITLYHHDGYWRYITKWPCSTGRQAGPKQKEGDQKTPQGAYFATRNVGHEFLTVTYGSRALPLDFPNWLDRHLDRTGSAIWLHGTNKPLRVQDSNGCVVLENSTIDRLAPYIRLHRTPVIIVERTRLWSVKASQKISDRILSAAQKWHNALMYGTHQEFSQNYAPGNEPSPRWWHQWYQQRRHQEKGADFLSQMRRRAIYRSGPYYVLLFDQYLTANSQRVWAGRRKLYFRVGKDSEAIIGDTFQAISGTAKDPLLFAWRKLWQKWSQRSKLATTEKKRRKTFFHVDYSTTSRRHRKHNIW